MPSFKSKQQQQQAQVHTSSSSFVVNVPACEWCNKTGAWRCKGCQRYTCNMCLQQMEFGKCTHARYRPLLSTGWGTPCPNGPCSKCSERGVILSNQQQERTKR